MSIARVAVSSGQSDTGGGTCSVTVSSSAQAGDLLFFVGVHNVAASDWGTPSGPGTLAELFDVVKGNARCAAWWKVCEAGDINQAYTFTATNAKRIVSCRVYSGVDTSSPPLFVTALQGGATTEHTTDELAIATAGSWLIEAYGLRDLADNNVWTPEMSGEVQSLTNTGTSQASLGVADSDGTVSAGNYTRTGTSSISEDDVVMMLFGLVPAAEASGTPTAALARKRLRKIRRLRWLRRRKEATL